MIDLEIEIDMIEIDKYRDRQIDRQDRHACQTGRPISIPQVRQPTLPRPMAPVHSESTVSLDSRPGRPRQQNRAQAEL